MRSALVRAQFDVVGAPDAAAAAVSDVEKRYAIELAAPLSAIAPDADRAIRSSLQAARDAAAASDAPAYAAARSDVWTTLLNAGYTGARSAVRSGAPADAEAWLSLREFRRATRMTRTGADATLALAALKAGTGSADDVALAIDADLLDAYQARLIAALDSAEQAQGKSHRVRLAEQGALAQGYFLLLRARFASERDPAKADAVFAALRSAALAGDASAQIAPARGVLEGFRAAPLSPADQARRAAQMIRFLKLVPVEYGRAVRNGKVAIDLEIREALVFQEGASAAFADLRDALPAGAQAAAAFDKLKRELNEAAEYKPAVDPAALSADVDALIALLQRDMPEAWLKQDSAGDFDVIATALDQVESAAAQGEYALAETARLNAYAILESGPEAKIAAFAPQYKTSIEAWFWYGGHDGPGLAKLIADQAPASTIRAARKSLDVELANAKQAISGSNAPEAVATNAGIIVFREGLEAVLILASLMASFRARGQTHLRRPMWIGAALAFVASIATWAVMRGTIMLFAQYGERLEAVVSLIAIGVLLLITNWFFHDVYWKGHMANQHKAKQSIVKGAAGQFIGLVLLGFSSIYREGFETALFLQSLVLEAGNGPVAIGALIGMAGVALIGVAIIALQARLPVMRMLVVTAILIGVVLLIMVGNTAHILQVIGWMPLTPIRWLQLPYWSGLWFGTYATVEGLALQFIAGAFTVGSYVLAKRVKHEAVDRSQIAAAMDGAGTVREAREDGRPRTADGR
jgi:high-affinity iron transporter